MLRLLPVMCLLMMLVLMLLVLLRRDICVG
jgi:hypothetical protein